MIRLVSRLLNQTGRVIPKRMGSSVVERLQQPKVTLCQMRTTDCIDETFACIEGFAKSAVSDGSCMMFLPENAVFMGTSKDASLAIAEHVDDQSENSKLERLKDICKRYAIWMSVGGFQEIALTDDHGATKKLSNAHLILDDQGKLVTVYRKIHLFDLEYTPENGDESKKIQLKESLFTEPGQGLVACDSPVGRLGLSVCFDVRFPELYQRLRYDMGAEVMLIPAAFTVPTGQAHWEILLRARAIETQSFVIASAQSGRHHAKRESYGHSMVIDPWGRILAHIDQTDSGCVTVPLDLESLQDIRMKIPMESSREQGRQRY
jgi:deaminated glutathione amidase